MTTKKIVAILIGIVLIAFGIGFLALNSKGYEISKNKDIGSINLDEKSTEAIDSIDKIYITAPIAKVNIIPEDRDNVHVHYHGHIPNNIKTDLVTKKVKNTLEIRTENKNHIKIGFSNFNNLEIFLDVYVPNNYSKNMDIESDLGDINISDFNLDQLEIDADLGNVNIENINAEKIEIDCDSGNIIAKSIKGDTKAKADLGNIELSYEDFNYNLDAVSNLGSITITLPKDANFNLNAKSNLGTVKSDFPVTTTESSNTKLKGTVGDGGKDIILAVDLGSIKIKSK